MNGYGSKPIGTYLGAPTVDNPLSRLTSIYMGGWSVCVCVYHLNRCKTSFLAGGHRGPGGVGDQRRHLPGTRVNVPAGLWWCTWAHLSRSWWPPQSHIYIYIYIFSFLLLGFTGVFFARPMHSTSTSR